MPPDGTTPPPNRAFPASTINGLATANGNGAVNGNGHGHTHRRLVLLLIDTQVSFLAPPPIGVPSAKTTGPNIAAVLQAARASPSKPLIVHVRNAGAFGEVDEYGSPGWELAFPPLPGEHVVDKRKNNGFVKTPLGEIIPPDAEVVVVGCQSDFCVRATCGAALSRGNEVALVRGAHATYDRVEPWPMSGTTPAAIVEAEIEDELEEAGVLIYEMKDLPHIFDER